MRRHFLLRSAGTHVAPRPEAAVSLFQEEPDTAVGEDSLLHGETLLVVSTGDAENVALPLVTQRVSTDLLAHALLVEGTNLK